MRKLWTTATLLCACGGGGESDEAKIHTASWGLQAIPRTPALNAVWPVSDTEVWVVGDGGTILRFDGESWALAASPTEQDLLAIWGSGIQTVSAVGARGTLISRQGSEWVEVASGTAATLRTVCGTGPQDLWAFGDAGAGVHGDGQTWSVVTDAAGLEVRGAWMSSEGIGLAVGTAGEHAAALSFTAGRWAMANGGLAGLVELADVWREPDGDPLAVGRDAHGGIGLRWTGTVWAAHEGAVPDRATAVLGKLVGSRAGLVDAESSPAITLVEGEVRDVRGAGGERFAVGALDGHGAIWRAPSPE